MGGAIKKILRDKRPQKEVLSLEISPIKKMYLPLKDAQVTYLLPIPMCDRSAVTREGQDIQFCEK